MKIEIKETESGELKTIDLPLGECTIKEAYNGIGLETRHGEEFGICMRDTGFEFNYGGHWWEAKEGKLRIMGGKMIRPQVEIDGVPYEQGIDPIGERAVNIEANYMDVAEQLYYVMNPDTKMDVPNGAYELTKKWYDEWLRTEPRSAKNIDFFRWCLKNKKKK